MKAQPEKAESTTASTDPVERVVSYPTGERKIDWEIKPQAMAMPQDTSQLKQGKYGPIFPKSPACYGFSIIAKIKPGTEANFYEYARNIEAGVAATPDLLDVLKLHYLRWNLFDINGETYFQYMGIFDTDFDKYTDDAVAIFSASGLDTVFENLEGFPEDWKTNPDAFVRFVREHHRPSFLEYGEYPYATPTRSRRPSTSRMRSQECSTSCSSHQRGQNEFIETSSTHLQPGPYLAELHAGQTSAEYLLDVELSMGIPARSGGDGKSVFDDDRSSKRALAGIRKTGMGVRHVSTGHRGNAGTFPSISSQFSKDRRRTDRSSGCCISAGRSGGILPADR